MSSNDEYQTPLWVIDFAKVILGDIHCDPATTKRINKQHRFQTFYTKETNGLKNPWCGNVWINPPYSKPLCNLFIDKLLFEWKQKNILNVLVLVNSSTSTKWYHKLLEQADSLLIYKKRINFLRNGNLTKSNRYDQSLFLFSRSMKVKIDFESLAANFGKVINLKYRLIGRKAEK